jgi:hypothetical protein
MPVAVEPPSRPGEPACPDHQTLWRFLTGRLADAEAEPIERHLEGCPFCLDRLGALSAHDCLLDEVRGRTSGPGPADEPETIASLILRLCQPAAGGAAGPSTWRSGLDTPADTPAPAGGARPPLAVPARLGRYRVLRPLGAGGMGAVYLADDPELGRPVAVKVPQFAGPPQAQATARQRFLREARAAAAVRHPHVCPIYDVGEHVGTPYVVMAFIEGRSLADRLEHDGRCADPRAAAALVLQVAEGLAAVHERGLIHRDLKPANVLLDAAGDAFLTDFGLARRQDEADRLTAPGALIGTLAYMAPEQADAAGGFGPVTPRTDVYSLGVVLYELLTGRRPFVAASLAGLLYQIVHATPAPPRQLRPDLDLALEAVVLKAMARPPRERYAGAPALAAALRGWLSGVAAAAPARPSSAAATAVPAGPSRPGPAVAHRRRWITALAASALVAALALLVYLALRPGPPATPETVPITPSAVPPLRGWIDVRVWKRAGHTGPDHFLPGRFLGEGVLPLQGGDEVRVEAQLNRPAYLYVVWIDSLGEPQPIYPWKTGPKVPKDQWWTLPPVEHKVDRLSLPDTPGARWAMKREDPRGMETLLLLARATPWPRDVDLWVLLADLPPAEVQHPEAAVWFCNWQVVFDEPGRGPNLFDVQRPHDPVIQTQEILRRRLGQYCAYSRAVSFANAGR